MISSYLKSYSKLYASIIYVTSGSLQQMLIAESVTIVIV